MKKKATNRTYSTADRIGLTMLYIMGLSVVILQLRSIL